MQPGVWRWTARHPAWKPGEDWGAQVSSFAVDDGERLLLLDPLAPPAELDALVAGAMAGIWLAVFDYLSRNDRLLTEHTPPTFFAQERGRAAAPR